MQSDLSSQNVCRSSYLQCAYAIRLALLGVLCSLLTACVPPDPPATNLPTSPAVLDITPAPTLDIDATATVLAGQLRPSPTQVGLYIVQPNDTLSDLAARFNTTVDEILAANGLTDPNALQEGQELIIPSLVSTPTLDPELPPANATEEISVTEIP